MKVSISPGTVSKGIVFKKTKHTVSFSVTMSSEEKEAVQALGIRNHSVVDSFPWKNGSNLDLEVFMLMDGQENVAMLDNEGQAMQLIEIFKGSLGNLKNHIEEYGGGTEAEEFEI